MPLCVYAFGSVRLILLDSGCSFSWLRLDGPLWFVMGLGCLCGEEGERVVLFVCSSRFLYACLIVFFRCFVYLFLFI